MLQKVVTIYRCHELFEILYQFTKCMLELKIVVPVNNDEVIGSKKGGRTGGLKANL